MYSVPDRFINIFDNFVILVILVPSVICDVLVIFVKENYTELNIVKTQP